MPRTFIVWLAVLCFATPLIWAKDKTAVPPGACVAVVPGGDSCRYTWAYHQGELMKSCYSYLESSKLPLKEVKTFYVKKDLESLEQRGVKVVVTTTEAAAIKGSICQ